MLNKNYPSLFISFIVVWLGHFIIDFMLGVWPVYKILAEIDLGKAGLIAGLGLFIGEGSQLIFGFCSSKYGYQKRLIVLGLIMASSVALLAYTENDIFLFIFMIMAYLGSGAFHPAAAGMVGSWSSTRKGVFLTLFASGGMAGAALSQVLFTKCYHSFNGHTLLLLIPVFCLILWLAKHQFPPRKLSEKKVSLKSILKWISPQRANICILFFTQVFMQAIILGFTFLLPDVLTLRGHDTWFCLGGGYFAYIIGAATMSVPAGYLADRYNHRSVLIGAVLISVVAFYFFLIAGPLPIFATALILFGMGGCMGIIHPVIVAAGNSLVSNHASSFISALLMGGASAIGSLGLIITGILASYFLHEPPVRALEVLGISYAIIVFLIFKLTVTKSMHNQIQLIPVHA